MKEKLYELLKSNLYEQEDVLFAGEGGSKATGLNDDFSDLDLELIVEDDAVEKTFELIEKLLEENFGILRRFRMPEPAWHGFSQVFYLIDKMPKHFYLDLAIIKKSIEEKLTDPARHGHAYIWFDKANVHQVVEETQEQVLSRCKNLYQRATQLDFLMMIEIEKNLDRNQFTESFPGYFRFISNQLAVMLNLQYRIEKVDFGLRYAYRDYPLEINNLLKDLLMVKDLDDLKNKYTILKDTYLKLKDELYPLYN